MTSVETATDAQVSKAARIANVRHWLLLGAFLVLVSPTIVNYSPYPLTWDESYYLDRIVCVNHAVYGFSWPRLKDCLTNTRKGPIMDVVNLPWGRAGGAERGIGLAFVGLGLFLWALTFAVYAVGVNAGIPPGSLLLAAVTICCTPFLRFSGGAMMTDTLLGWCVALALLLIPLEYCKPSTGFWPSILRGLLWGITVDIGMLAKVTSIFFLVLIGLALLFIRERHSGEMPLRYCVAATLLASVPALLIWILDGWRLIGFGGMSAWGGASQFWSVPKMTAAGYCWRYFSQLGWALIPLSIQVFIFVRGMLREKRYRLGRLLPLLILLGYLGIAARSQNRDPRFLIPLMIAMPLCLAWKGMSKASPVRLGPIPWAIAALAAVLSVLPMQHRPNLVPIDQARMLLQALSDKAGSNHSVSVLLADDGPGYNFNTFELARDLEEKKLGNVILDTLVYEVLNKRSADDGLKRIDSADFVLFLKPTEEPGPSWSRAYDAQYRAHAEKVGVLQDSSISAEFAVFSISKKPVPR